MAKDTNRIIDETVGAFKRLKEEIKGYKDELATLTVGSEKWTQTAQKLANAQKQVDAINKAAKGTLVDYNNLQQNSINALKEKIKLLNQERNAMDMNSKEYADATKQLKVLNDQLREAGTSAGDWKANVGNYANSIKDAFGQLGGAATGLAGNMGGLNASMLKLASNPVGAVVLALVGAIKFLAEGIKSSEENTKRWNEAMVPVKTVMTMIQKAAQDAADKFLTFVESLKSSDSASKVIQTTLQVVITLFNQVKDRITNMGEAIVSIYNHIKDYVGKMKEWADGLKDTFQPVIDFVDKIKDKIKESLEPVIDWIIEKYNWLAKSDLGKLFGLQTIESIKKSWDDAGKSVEKYTEDYKETEKEVRKVTKLQNELNSSLNGLMTKEAQLRKEVAAANREYQEALENKDYEKAQDALVKKQEKELELARTKKAVAGANLQVLQEEAKLTANSAEANRALAQAKAAVIDADAGIEEAAAQAAKEQKKLNSLIDAQDKADRAEKFKAAVAELTQELNKYQQTYASTVAGMETPNKPEDGDITSDSLSAYYDQINANAQAEYEAYAAMVEAKIAKLEEFIEAEKAAGNDTLIFETQLAKLREEQTSGYAVQYKKMVDTVTKSDKDRAKVLKNLQKSELQGYANLFDSVSGLFEQNTVAYKATATAKALISTYLAATGALADTPGGPIARAVAMAATLATGLAQVISIWKVNPKGETSPSTAQPSTPSIAEPVMVDSQPFTYTRTAQTFEEEDQLNQPMFVSVTDINNVQNRVKVVEQESSF